MEEKLIGIVAATLGVRPSQLRLDTAAGELEAWDSLAHINIVSEVESGFGVSIPIEEIAEIRRIADFLPYLGRAA